MNTHTITIRDARYVDPATGRVALRPEYDRDVVAPDRARIAVVYGTEQE